MKIVYMILVAYIFIGCDDYYEFKKEPFTKQEMIAIQAHEKELLKNYVPNSLSGDDQDWEDLIEEAHQNAVESCAENKVYRCNGTNNAVLEIRTLNDSLI